LDRLVARLALFAVAGLGDRPHDRLAGGLVDDVEALFLDGVVNDLVGRLRLRLAVGEVGLGIALGGWAGRADGGAESGADGGRARGRGWVATSARAATARTAEKRIVMMWASGPATVPA